VTNRKIRVGVLGATGIVGQRFIQLLAEHPLFEVTAVAASDRSQGRAYGEACAWRLPGEIPARVRPLIIESPQPPLDCDVILSSLPADTAREAEPAFAHAGYPVISNASAFRMEPDVPMIIPEVNPGHIAVLEQQQRNRGFSSGYIVTNPNCSTVNLALALAPLHARFGVEAVIATTIQAVSGAGYPGVASLDVIDNVLPHIEGEEAKMEREPQKILGEYSHGQFEPAKFAVSAQCHRANVSDGHVVAVRVKLARSATLEEVRAALADFRSAVQELRLPSAPGRPIIVRDEADRPQPRLDRDAGNGMSVTIGRISKDTVLDYRFVTLSHNTIRGAAGAAILNAELLEARGLLRRETELDAAAAAGAAKR